MNNELIINELKNNKIVAYPTDTVFGLMIILDKKNISKLNLAKKRIEDQPLQILFSSLKEASQFFKKNYFTFDYLANNFKNKTSYIVEVNDYFNEKYLLKSFKKTIMFRIPSGEIQEILKKTGPVFATSVNIHGKDPMTDNKQIADTFSITVSNIEQQTNKPSHIISIINQEIKELR